MSKEKDPYMAQKTRVPLGDSATVLTEGAVTAQGVSSPLSEETQKGLALLQQAVAENLSKGEAEVKEDPTPSEEPEGEEVDETKILHPTLSAILNNYYYTNSKVDNVHVRGKIEARLDEFDLDEVLFSDTLTQEVPILTKGKLTVVYRSIRKSDSNWIDTQAMSRYKTAVEQGNFIQDARLTFQVAEIRTAKKAVNLPSICKDERTPEKVDAEAFDKKLNTIRGLKENLIVLLTHNMNWFNDRIDSAPMGELLGNT